MECMKAGLRGSADVRKRLSRPWPRDGDRDEDEGWDGVNERSGS